MTAEPLLLVVDGVAEGDLLCRALHRTGWTGSVELATDGRSKVLFADALRKAGAKVDHCFVVFFYDIFPNSQDLMKELGVELHYLATWWDVLDAAKEMKHFDERTLREVESFLNDPAKWSAAHGGISDFAPATTA